MFRKLIISHPRGGFFYWRIRLLKKYRQAFLTQKSNAKNRGIGWELSFDQWMEFWGEDIDRRGSGANDLQMQRPCDTGPYAIGNIRKGTPKQNSITCGAMSRLRRVTAAAENVRKQQDTLMWAESAPDKDNEFSSEEEFWDRTRPMGFASKSVFVR